MTVTEKLQEILQKEQLVAYFEQGGKPQTDWGIGTENEIFLYKRNNLTRLGYNSGQGISTIFKHLQTVGWEPLMEREKIIALKKDGASITLEPGGQFELSGKKLKTVHQTYTETKKHFEELKTICQKFGFFSLSMGADPLWKLEELPWMPKKRYALMKEYMPTRGRLGLEMMGNTASIQVNLDYASEADMVRKMRVAQALQPIMTAIFANSPFSGGKPNGYLSYRAHIWDNTDPDRCGFLPFIFDEGFGFERWVEYLLDIPMYFIFRNDDYLPANGMTFREFLKGKHQIKPTMQDWETHISTIFPDVRLKQFIETRGADASCSNHIVALSAMWVGLLYDKNSLDKAEALISNWDIKTMQEVRAQVPRKGLNAASGNIHAGTVARQIYKIAFSGLTRRNIKWGSGDESQYLEPLQEITEHGITRAEKILHSYYHDYNEDLMKLLHNRQIAKLKGCSSE